MLLSLIGCSYQKNELKPVEKTNSEQLLPPVDIQTGSEVVIDEDDVALEKDIFDLFDAFFKNFVVITSEERFDTLVDYEKLFELRKIEEPNFLKLVATIEKKLESTKVLESADQKTRIAYFINAYNYLAIRLINKNYVKNGKKIKSIKDLSSGVNPFEIFSRKIARVDGKLVSLDDIEKGIVLPESGNDPRIHFAVICVSKGCPVTLNAAYRGEKLEEQLDFVSKSGLALPRMYKSSGPILKLSKIFNWYESDFTNSSFGSILGFINNYREDISAGNFEFQDYDWNINIYTGEARDVVVDDIGSSSDERFTCKEREGLSLLSTCDELMNGRLDGNNRYKVSKATLCLYESDSKLVLKGSVDEKNNKDELGSRNIDLSEKKSEDQGIIGLKQGSSSVSFDISTNEMTILERGNVLRWMKLRHYKVLCH